MVYTLVFDAANKTVAFAKKTVVDSAHFAVFCLDVQIRPSAKRPLYFAIIQKYLNSLSGILTQADYFAARRFMRIRNLVFSISFFLAVASLHAAPTANPSSDFTLSNASHIPGVTLQPGNYTIQEVNHLSDRVVLRVTDSKGKVHTTFLGVINPDIPKPAEKGPVAWDNPVGSANYMKGWYFPDATGVIEFVYPKDEAVSIATANPSKVPAIDPASEGKSADKPLARDDMQVLTLWLLSLQEVGPAAPTGGIKAERLQQVASVDYRPAIKALPHTASLMPLVWMIGFGLLLAAGCLRWSEQSRRTSRPPTASSGKV